MMLFVCSQGKIRSRTAEVLCLMAGMEARSCGTDDSAIVRVSDGLIREAEVIVCMEHHHVSVLQEMNFMHLDLARVIELGIEDIYVPFDPSLVEKLIESLGGALQAASVAIKAGQERRNGMFAAIIERGHARDAAAVKSGELRQEDLFFATPEKIRAMTVHLTPESLEKFEL